LAGCCVASPSLLAKSSDPLCKQWLAGVGTDTVSLVSCALAWAGFPTVLHRPRHPSCWLPTIICRCCVVVSAVLQCRVVVFAVLHHVVVPTIPHVSSLSSVVSSLSLATSIPPYVQRLIAVVVWGQLVGYGSCYAILPSSRRHFLFRGVWGS
jgi:hypothetical protein